MDFTTTSYGDDKPPQVDVFNVEQSLVGIRTEEEEDAAGFTPEDQAALNAYFTELERKEDDTTPHNPDEDDDVPSPEVESSLANYFQELKRQMDANEPYEVDSARLAALASSRRHHNSQQPPP